MRILFLIILETNFRIVLEHLHILIIYETIFRSVKFYRAIAQLTREILVINTTQVHAVLGPRIS